MASLEHLRKRAKLYLLMIAATASQLPAQSRAARTGEQLEDSLKTHQAEFDYLLGDWEFTMEIHGESSMACGAPRSCPEPVRS